MVHHGAGMQVQLLPPYEQLQFSVFLYRMSRTTKVS